MYQYSLTDIASRPEHIDPQPLKLSRLLCFFEVGRSSFLVERGGYLPARGDRFIEIEENDASKEWRSAGGRSFGLFVGPFLIRYCREAKDYVPPALDVDQLLGVSDGRSITG
mgnify:CR=1 FL=1